MKSMTNKEAVEAMMRSFGLWDQDGTQLFMDMLTHIMDEKDARYVYAKTTLSDVLDMVDFSDLPSSITKRIYEVMGG